MILRHHCKQTSPNLSCNHGPGIRVAGGNTICLSWKINRKHAIGATLLKWEYRSPSFILIITSISFSQVVLPAQMWFS